MRRPDTLRNGEGRAIHSVSISFYRFGGLGARLWAFAQMGLARRGLARVPGIGFWKMMGSGTGEGFTPVPNTAVWAILATWPDIDTARAARRLAPFSRFEAHAAEHWTVYLSPFSARGQWSGQVPFDATDQPASTGRLAALTRATVRPTIMHRFWGRVPAISAAIGQNRDVMFKIGLGEVPWVQQVTFSIWPDAASMARFARADGPHARAIKAVREGGWFAEELYARFNVTGEAGSWGGASPLSTQRIAA